MHFFLQLCFLATAAQASTLHTTCNVWKKAGYCDTNLKRIRDHTRWLCPNTCGAGTARFLDGYVDIPAKYKGKHYSPYESVHTSYNVFDTMNMRMSEVDWDHFSCPTEPTSGVDTFSKTIRLISGYPCTYNVEYHLATYDEMLKEGQAELLTDLNRVSAGSHWVPMHDQFNISKNVCNRHVMSITADSEFQAIKFVVSPGFKPHIVGNVIDAFTNQGHGRYYIGVFDKRVGLGGSKYLMRAIDTISDGESQIGRNTWRSAGWASSFYCEDRQMFSYVDIPDLEEISILPPMQRPTAQEALENCVWLTTSHIANVPLILSCPEHTSPINLYLHSVGFGGTSLYTFNLNYHIDDVHGGISYLWAEYNQATKYFLGLADYELRLPSEDLQDVEIATIPRYHVVVFEENTNFIKRRFIHFIHSAFSAYDPNPDSYKYPCTEPGFGERWAFMPVKFSQLAHVTSVCGTFSPPLGYCGIHERDCENDSGQKLQWGVDAYKYMYNALLTGPAATFELTVHYNSKHKLSDFRTLGYGKANEFGDDDYEECHRKPFYILGAQIALCFPHQAQDFYGNKLKLTGCVRQGGYYYRCVAEAFVGLVYPAGGPMLPVAYPYIYGGWRKLYANPPDTIERSFYQSYRGASVKYAKSIDNLLVWGPLAAFLGFVVSVWILMLIYLLIALVLSLLEWLTCFKKGSKSYRKFHGTYFVHCFLSFAYLGYPGYKPAWFKPDRLATNANNAKTLHNAKWVALSYIAVLLFPIYVFVIIVLGILSIARIAKKRVKVKTS
ncbi:putative glycoprotein 1 [Beihai Nido-like virus 2]|uniref:Putative glycoprotein 1 n=1 Tax=Beihai Nido-like virus 2 TaxID=1922351 RepID=A0A1L3KIW8_9NIDO|nr:putative glycoprotein 1 [Beihai Nido-like virus 2]APG77314.1 putative glycoprotein 1 [Beihai Nido-like virus 2]